MITVTSCNLQQRASATIGNPPLTPAGSQGWMDDCCFAAGCARGSRGSGGFLRGGRGRAAPVREGSVLTLCLDTLNTVISDSEGLWPNQSLCYWTSAGDYSSQTFDIGRCQMVPASFLHHFRTFFQELCHGYIFLTLKKM